MHGQSGDYMLTFGEHKKSFFPDFSLIMGTLIVYLTFKGDLDLEIQQVGHGCSTMPC
jgi:hypothetical protein